jgi:tetratricopeptide (TPR) repeat protein
MWIVLMVLALPLLLPAQQAPNSEQAPPTLQQSDAQKGQAAAQAPAGQSQAGKGQTGQAANGQAAAAPYQPTPDEVKAAQAIQTELDPNQVIKMAQDFEQKYPKSPYLANVYFFAANAYQQKNDVAQSIANGEKSLQIQPNSVPTLVLLTTLLPQPQDMQGTDQDKDNKLKETETDAAKVLDLLKTLPKPASATDDQFQKLKANIQSEVHSALGMDHEQKALMNLAGPDPTELSKAEAEYKLAVAGPQPNAQDYYRLGEVCEMENKLDAAIDAFTKSGQIGQGTMMQTLANQKIQEINKKKAQATAPAKK